MSRPRFIAGAICPQCGRMDRLQIHSEDGVRIRRCVACGYRDGLPVVQTPAPKSRLAGRGEERGRAPVQPVRFLGPDQQPDTEPEDTGGGR